MSGKWHAFLPSRDGERDKPRIVEYGKHQDWCYPTREAAVAALRKQLRKQLNEAKQYVTELESALGNLDSMGEEP